MKQALLAMAGQLSNLRKEYERSTDTREATLAQKAAGDIATDLFPLIEDLVATDVLQITIKGKDANCTVEKKVNPLGWRYVSSEIEKVPND
jgi:hypothetical protein